MRTPIAASALLLSACATLTAAERPRPAADREPPRLTLALPDQQSSWVRGTVAVEVGLWSEEPAEVVLSVGGSQVMRAPGPYTVSVDTREYVPGLGRLDFTAAAEDASGNRTVAHLMVRVMNDPVSSGAGGP